MKRSNIRRKIKMSLFIYMLGMSRNISGLNVNENRHMGLGQKISVLFLRVARGEGGNTISQYL